jgi:hypothetical protein
MSMRSCTSCEKVGGDTGGGDTGGGDTGGGDTGGGDNFTRGCFKIFLI